MEFFFPKKFNSGDAPACTVAAWPLFPWTRTLDGGREMVAINSGLL